MNKETFWSIIEEAKKRAEGACYGAMDRLLTEALSALPVEEILCWQQIFQEYQRLSYKEKLWAAAYVINGGCSDDGFDYFRAWLTAQGKELFLAALAQPDCLADCEQAKEDETEFEEMLCVACDAYFKVCGMKERNYEAFYSALDRHPLPEHERASIAAEIRYAPDIDEEWDEDSGLSALLPKLCAKFEWVDDDDGADSPEPDASASLEEKIRYWHENERHADIIIALEALPELNYDQIGQLARAYNNIDNYDKAMELLDRVREQGEADPLWQYRRGYALYYLDREEEGAACFEKAIELGGEDADTRELLDMCQEEIERKQGTGEGAHYAPEMYEEAELDAVEAHIQTHFGNYENVFHEIASPDIHVDIAVIKPTPERNYYTLVTMGMGAHRMNVPEELREKKLDRAEILVTLPPDWDINNDAEEWYWPLRWLKNLARLPIEYDTWLGWGHTVPNGEPFADNTKLSVALLSGAYGFGEESAVCVLPDGDEVNFYQFLPLYDEECEYKVNNGMSALEEYFPDDFSMVVDITRKNYLIVEGSKPYGIPAHKMKPLYQEDGPQGCLATDRITVDGEKVGYLYREEPDNGADSGWRFLAGDESQAYMDNSDFSAVYALNTICNYDPDIIPLLDSPSGTAYYRDQYGVFREEKTI